jgi:hypothetical protein
VISLQSIAWCDLETLSFRSARVEVLHFQTWNGHSRILAVSFDPIETSGERHRLSSIAAVTCAAPDDVFLTTHHIFKAA